MDDIYNADNIEEIAVVGLACKFPGAKNIEQFWQNLCNGVESRAVFSDEDIMEALGEGIMEVLGSEGLPPNYVKSGFVLNDTELFDADFFEFTPLKARMTDPQQRLFLECAWQAFENAGIDTINSKDMIAVYASVGLNLYFLRLLNSNLYSVDNTFEAATLNEKDYVATQTAYKLNLKGAAVNVQTACSSGLVATHLACQSLLNHECDVALTGGATVDVFQKLGYIYHEGAVTSPDGHCRAFDIDAQGTVFSNGVGTVVLKRLSDAIADHDHIWAVIKGSAVNNDGVEKVGFTAPSVKGQIRVISEALSVAGVQPNTITYIETHGTATQLGDPIEIAALNSVFGTADNQPKYCGIGSLKTNVGHMGSVAGIGGFIKTVLMLKYKMLPPSLHFKQPNPKIDFAKSPFYVNTKLSKWETNGIPCRAGVSSYGVGGTNAHVILEEPPLPEIDNNKTLVERPLHLLTLKAKSKIALNDLIKRYINYLEHNTDLKLANICFTANTGRTPFKYRLGVIASNTLEMQEKLKAIYNGEEVLGVFEGQEKESLPQIAFLFSGQGGQHVGMGQQLYQTQPLFGQIINQCDKILQPYLAQPLLSVLYPELYPIHNDTELEQENKNNQFKINLTAYTQPALFALEYALAKLWQSWGIEATVVSGHSVGEYVAACLAGVFSLEDGLKLIAERGRLMQALPKTGEMWAVFADEAYINKEIALYTQDVSIAAINGPERIVISGKTEIVTLLINKFKKQGIKTKKLKTSHAFHSPLMEPMLTAFEKVAREITYHPPKIKIVSNVTGKVIDEEIATPQYWCEHIRQPVKFEEGMITLQTLGVNTFIEMGPKPTLLSIGKHCLSDDDEKLLWTPSLRQGQIDWNQLLSSLASLHVQGISVDWFNFDKAHNCQKVVLPTYPFQRQRYWIEKENLKTVSQHSSTNQQLTLHPLLGKQLHLAHTQQICFESQLNAKSVNYLKDHTVFNKIIFPATAYLEMALAAGNVILKTDKLNIKDFFIQKALILPDNESVTLQFVLNPENNGYNWQVFSRTTSSSKLNEEPPIWTPHASGQITTENQEDSVKIDLTTLQSRCQQEVKLQLNQKQTNQGDVNYGPSFQATQQLNYNEEESIGLVNLPEMVADQAPHYKLHPVLLDACLRMVGVLPVTKSGGSTLPIALTDLKVLVENRAFTTLWCHAKMRSEGNSQVADFDIFDIDGYIVAKLTGLIFRQATRQSLLASHRYADWLYQITWQQANRPHRKLAEALGKWVIFTDKGNIGANLATLLDEYGEETILVSSGKTYKKNAKHYELDPLNATQFNRLFQDILSPDSSKKETLPLRGIIYLWPINLNTATNELTNELIQKSQQICIQAVYLVQSVIKTNVTPRLWLVTQGAQQIQKEHLISPQQAPLWGVGQTIAWEHPELQCVCLDLAQDKTISEMQLSETLFKEVWYSDTENQVTIRQGKRYVARLARYANRDIKPIKFDDQGCYLITGGLGGLGLQMATVLAEEGVQCLILTGRSAISSPDTQQAVDNLEEMGIQVIIVQADISKEEDVIKLIESCPKPLRGIIHAAGVINDTILLQQSATHFEEVMAAKVAGSWYLHQLTKEMALDFFVCFSSTASVLGAVGQANYAAANAFMDALVHYRSQHNLPALSINWGGWSEVGMAAELLANNHKQTTLQTVKAITPEDGKQVFVDILNYHNLNQVTVLPVNWDLFFKQPSTGTQLPLFLLMEQMVQQKTKEKLETNLYEQLKAVSDEERFKTIETYLKKLVARTVGVNLIQVNIESPLNTIGFDSLMAINFRNKIKADLKADIPIVTFLEDTSIIDLVRLILNKLFQTEQSEQLIDTLAPKKDIEVLPIDASSEQAGQLLAKLDQLSDEEVNALLELELLEGDLLDE